MQALLLLTAFTSIVNATLPSSTFLPTRLKSTNSPHKIQHLKYYHHHLHSTILSSIRGGAIYDSDDEYDDSDYDEEEDWEEDDDLFGLDSADFDAAEDDFSEDLDVDDELWGEIVRVTSFGAYVKLGTEVDGWLHFMDHPSWTPGLTPKEFMQVGDRIRCWVRKVDLDMKRLQVDGNRPKNLPGPRREIQLR